MPVYLLDDNLWFPPVEEAESDGLLAVGGDLSAARLLLAYHSGIFPWYNEDDPLMWWSPDPRFVLFPNELKVSKSMKQVIGRHIFEFRFNTAFEQVIAHCSQQPRKGQDGTWIGDDIIKAYTQLHRMGHAHSAEAWQDGKLVGGLYGVLLGRVFFGESMFSLQPNASKFAFIQWVQQLAGQGIQLIDCQLHTAHLESLGAKMVTRGEFLEMISIWSI